MVDWKSAEVLLLCAILFAKVVIFLLGAYSWYILESWHIVEGALIARRTKFAPIHIPYLIARYGHLTSLVLLCALTQLPLPVIKSCRTIGFSRSCIILNNIAVVAASANLGLRAYTLWKDSVMIRIFMVIGCIGHFIYAVLMGILTVRAIWSDHHTHCVALMTTFENIIAGFFIYTMIWDTVIFSCTILGLRKARLNILPSNNALLNALKAQGVGYAAVAWLTSIPVAIILLLDPNPSLNAFLSTLGTTTSVIASCKMVVSLRLKDGDSEGATSGSDSRSLETNPNLFTTNIHLTEFNPNSSCIESVSRHEKNAPEKQSDRLQQVV